MKKAFLVGASFNDGQWFGYGVRPFFLVEAESSQEALEIARSLKHLLNEEDRLHFERGDGNTDPYIATLEAQEMPILRRE